LSGSEMTIGENGGTTATDLGIRSLVGTTTLADLNGGKGVGVVGDNNDPGVIRITDRLGATYDVDISTATTVQDVIVLVNAATGGAVTAALAASGNGIELTDTTGGGGDLSVQTVSANGHYVAKQLGFYDSQGNDGVSVSGNTLTGADVHPVMPDGLFSHLIALRDAVRTSGDPAARDAAIAAADNAMMQDHENLSRVHGLVGANARALEQKKLHIEDNILASEMLRSDIRDIDFTEAITRYENLYTALQANLATASQLTNVSLLDFLR